MSIEGGNVRPLDPAEAVNVERSAEADISLQDTSCPKGPKFMGAASLAGPWALWAVTKAMQIDKSGFLYKIKISIYFTIQSMHHRQMHKPLRYGVKLC